MAKWLMKADPVDYGIDDLRAEAVTPWDGVRNYQARNFMREMRPGDQVLLYHSGRNPGVVGLGEVRSEPYPDPTQFDPESPYYDPKSDRDSPRWDLVDIGFVDELPHEVSLATIKADEALVDMLLVTRSRLSVMPVTDTHFAHILALAGYA